MINEHRYIVIVREKIYFLSADANGVVAPEANHRWGRQSGIIKIGPTARRLPPSLTTTSIINTERSDGKREDEEAKGERQTRGVKRERQVPQRELGRKKTWGGGAYKGMKRPSTATTKKT